LFGGGRAAQRAADPLADRLEDQRGIKLRFWIPAR
jgi:hypothetical protein